MTNVNAIMTSEQVSRNIRLFRKTEKADLSALLRETINHASFVSLSPENKGNKSLLLAAISAINGKLNKLDKLLISLIERMINCAETHSAECALANRNRTALPNWEVKHANNMAMFDKEIEIFMLELAAKKEETKAKIAATREAKKAEKTIADKLLTEKLENSFTVDEIIAGILSGDKVLLAIASKIAEAFASVKANNEPENAIKRKRIKQTA